ncbi:MAG: ATPase [Prolixibacteraceae bacterium]|nr:ATPase [Prolixibacteraceae bacterium]
MPFSISVLSIFFFLYDIGFEHQSNMSEVLLVIYTSTLIIGTISIIVRYFFQENRPRLKVLPFDIILLLFLILLILQQLNFNFFLSVFKQLFWIYIGVFTVFIREFAALKIDLKRTVINPAQLFIISFLVIIVIGALLLMLPETTHSRISFIDAMFTSTSAVCVTGLLVVDTGSFFTESGQTIIILLIQIGGIGIMTFASYFSYFFRGDSTYKSQLAIREMTNTEKIGEVFSTLKKILLITLLIEGTGALLIFQSIDSTVLPVLSDRIFFSVFHSVSGFCNAGFSTLENSFYEASYRFNYPLHLTIASLFILGGLGFPIVLNLLKYLRTKIKSYFLILFGKKYLVSSPWIININTRIVLFTSLILAVFGTLFFFLFEYNNTLSDHSFTGKIVTAFFGAVTTRTAGFNTVDTASLKISTILIVIFLMWIGASPGSTGGGIKTSTFAIAVLNVLSIAKGKSRLEIFKREISSISVNRAFAIIILSITVILISIFLISFFDPDKALLNIFFECVSAYSTVGLSRGITAELSTASKSILILTMFIGRINMLTILIAIFKKVSSENYRFPTENILIN